MGDWYQEIIDCRRNGSKTGSGAVFNDPYDARSHFAKAKELEVSSEQAEFLLDLHNECGDLVDTVLLDSSGFKAVTGEQPKSVAEYEAYDRSYWSSALGTVKDMKRQDSLSD